MRILVLDTIHGGDVLAKELSARGHEVDAADVYRGPAFPADKDYDLVAAPVHLDPDHPLLRKAPVITHHELLSRLIAPPGVSVEITGARGKTTTAFALAGLFEGAGVLHTSSGTFSFPERTLLFRKSITPASVLSAAENTSGWLIAEESLGVCGFGTLGILTSPGDYRIAAGKKSALAAKLDSLKRCGTVLVPEGVPREPGWHCTGDLVSVDGDTLSCQSGTFRNPLLLIPGYREALKTAAAAGVLLGLPVGNLAAFKTLPGRMHLSRKNGIAVMDNSASGTNADNTILAAEYLRKLHPEKPVTLVIGMEERAVCEGFSDAEILRAAKAVAPKYLIRVGGDSVYRTFAEAESAAYAIAETAGTSLLFAVKTWR
jgi:UDP-N-acetylmuramyl pentapeptide synthase